MIGRLLGAFLPLMLFAAGGNGGNGGGRGPSLEELASAYTGRNQGPEFFYSFQHNGTAGPVQVPRQLNINRPLEAVIVRWRGRVVIAGANYDAVAAEAPYTIIDRLQVQGTWKGNQLTPIFMSGATVFSYMRLFQVAGNTALFTTTRQADPSSPFQQVGTTFGNTGTYDLDIYYILPVGPIINNANRSRANVSFLWQPQDWSNLQVTIFQGDRTSFGTPNGATTVTWTAFGSASGSPEISIYTRYEILGPLRAGFRTSCVIRNEQVIPSGQGLSSVANNVQLLPTLAKQKTLSILVKTGINLTGTTSGVTVFASLTDTMLDMTQIQVDNRPIKNTFNNLVSKWSTAQRYNTVHPQGYFLLPFIDGQQPRTAYRADLSTVVGPQATFALVTNVLAATANQQANVIQEMVFSDNDDPYWMGTR